jgi:hypothetical protein
MGADSRSFGRRPSQGRKWPWRPSVRTGAPGQVAVGDGDRAGPARGARWGAAGAGPGFLKVSAGQVLEDFGSQALTMARRRTNTSPSGSRPADVPDSGNRNKGQEVSPWARLTPMTTYGFLARTRRCRSPPASSK